MCRRHNRGAMARGQFEKQDRVLKLLREVTLLGRAPTPVPTSLATKAPLRWHPLGLRDLRYGDRMKTCAQCGAEVTGRFCSSCGAATSEPVTVPTWGLDSERVHRSGPRSGSSRQHDPLVGRAAASDQDCGHRSTIST